MNIFAKVVFTSHEILKEILVERLEVSFEKSIGEINIFTKKTPENTLIFIHAPSTLFEESIAHIKENYEILKVLCIGQAVGTDTLETQMGDVMIPNTFINTQNEVYFSEYVVDQNYDFNKFGLILNGICLSLENQITSLEELNELKEKYACEVIDFEAFYQCQVLEKYEILDKSVIIKALGTTKEELTNGADILHLILD